MRREREREKESVHRDGEAPAQYKDAGKDVLNFNYGLGTAQNKFKQNLYPLSPLGTLT